jgi:pSer/pThr/pTyr-binding forkhead associated (FHA) protein
LRYPTASLTALDMSDSPLAAHASSPSELVDRLEASRQGAAFLVYRDGEGRQRIHALEQAHSRATIGRAPSSDVSLPWDGGVSRLHALLERVGEEWTVTDEGLSRNGTFRNGKQIGGRHRLRDGDELRFGRTVAVFCSARNDSLCETALHEVLPARSITPAQRRVLTALCRPLKEGSSYAAPATNGEIAEQEFLSVDVIKTHLRALYRTFGIDAVAQNRKRGRLVELAFKTGTIGAHEL